MMNIYGIQIHIMCDKDDPLENNFIKYNQSIEALLLGTIVDSNLDIRQVNLLLLNMEKIEI